MNRRITALLTGAALLTLPMAPASADTVLNVVTAGDQNMVDYINDYLGPKFEESHPGVTVRAVGTGPGDAGSLKIFEKLDAEAKAGTSSWDIDVAVVHQRGAAQMLGDDLLSKYRDEIPTGKLVTRDTADNALGTNVTGYVMPMFHSQIAIAYNPEAVTDPPKSYADLAKWVADHPGEFGYNGIKGGMSGVGFVMGWVEAYTGEGQELEKGPYDPAMKPKIEAALAEMKPFNANVTMTPGNAGTLDMLNRGEIDMGPVWVDMFYTWRADGKMNPDIKLELISPGLPGQPMYYVIPAKAASQDLARDFVALATSPEVQAEGIVKRFNWYPGIDAQNVESKLDKDTWAKLFTDVTPEDLASKGKPFPLSDYFTDVLETYERVAN
jgi:ABC-type uncharacterized transport system YnjBCD substrate-binding protein